MKVNISLGLKAGLASGVIYGALIGFLHAGLLEACSSTQLSFINQNLIASPIRSRMISYYTSESASDVFGSDLLHFPIYWAIGALIAGVAYGVVFSAIYPKLPGFSSRTKGMWMGVIVYVVGTFLGLSGLEVTCSPSVFSILGMLGSLPISIADGYFLGMFYDSFGALSKEERAELLEQKQLQGEDDEDEGRRVRERKKEKTRGRLQKRGS